MSAKRKRRKDMGYTYTAASKTGPSISRGTQATASKAVWMCGATTLHIAGDCGPIVDGWRGGGKGRTNDDKTDVSFHGYGLEELISIDVFKNRSPVSEVAFPLICIYISLLGQLEL